MYNLLFCPGQIYKLLKYAHVIYTFEPVNERVFLAQCLGIGLPCFVGPSIYGAIADPLSTGPVADRGGGGLGSGPPFLPHDVDLLIVGS